MVFICVTRHSIFPEHLVHFVAHAWASTEQQGVCVAARLASLSMSDTNRVFSLGLCCLAFRKHGLLGATAQMISSKSKSPAITPRKIRVGRSWSNLGLFVHSDNLLRGLIQGFLSLRRAADRTEILGHCLLRSHVLPGILEQHSVSASSRFSVPRQALRTPTSRRRIASSARAELRWRKCFRACGFYGMTHFYVPFPEALQGPPLLIGCRMVLATAMIGLNYLGAVIAIRSAKRFPNTAAYNGCGLMAIAQGASTPKPLWGNCLDHCLSLSKRMGPLTRSGLMICRLGA